MTKSQNNCEKLSQPQTQHNVTQPQHSGWVGHENDFGKTRPSHHHRNSTAASVSLRTTFIDYNNNNNNFNNNYYNKGTSI